MKTPNNTFILYTIVDKNGDLVENSAGLVLLSNYRSAENELESFDHIQSAYAPHALVTLVETKRKHSGPPGKKVK